MSKSLTGEHIHETFNNTIHNEWRELHSWNEIAKETQETYNAAAALLNTSSKPLTGKKLYQSNPAVVDAWGALGDKQNVYNEVAKRLNQDLGLCEQCGERPQAPNMMLEVAGDNICSDCCEHPVDDPKVQYIHFALNARGEIMGAIVPPAGMSIEDYQAQLKEKMSNIAYELEFPVWNSDKTDSVVVPTMQALLEALQKHVRDLNTLGCDYSISVLNMKDETSIGKGCYKLRMNGEVDIISEIDAAEGLSDALYEYSFMNSMTGEEDEQQQPA